jgi:hypothetical protein
MTSQINPATIDGNYPIAGVPNNTQGMRDNFTAIKTNFQYAETEIDELQSKGVFKAALTGTTLDNNMGNNLIYNARIQGFSGTLVQIANTSGTITVDCSAGPYQTIIMGGNISISFTTATWPAAGSVGIVRLQITVDQAGRTMTLPATVSLGTTGIQGYSANVITFAAAGVYEFGFLTYDQGLTITLFDYNRPLNYYTDTVTIASTLNSTSSISGALTVAGGAGINGNLYVGGNIFGNFVVTSQSFVGNVAGGNLNTGGVVSATANVVGGNIRTAGQVSAGGNVTGAYIIGDGSQLTNIVAAAGATIVYGTSNVRVNPTGNVTVNITGIANIAQWTTSGEYVTGLISATGNIIGGNISTNGTIGASSIGVGGIVSASGNVIGSNVLTGGIVSATGNVTGGNIRTAGLVTSTGNVTGGNLLTSGTITANGNITGNYILGNGSQLTGLPTSYSNSNVSTYLASGINNSDIITSANISGSYVLGNGALLTGIAGGTRIVSGTTEMAIDAPSGNLQASIGGTPNVVVFTPTGVSVTGYVSATGNITGGNANINGILSATANVTGGNFLTAGLISAAGSITSNGNVNATGNINLTANIIAGNLTTGSQVVAVGNVTGGNIRTDGQVLALNATAIPAGGLAGKGYVFSSTANFGIFFGSGVPTLAAAKGSLYLRSDGSTTNDRMYVNTNGTTSWTAVITAA